MVISVIEKIEGFENFFIKVLKVQNDVNFT